jgi:hypothetical protein
VSAIYSSIRENCEFNRRQNAGTSSPLPQISQSISIIESNSVLSK